jgi:transposase-like protein
MPRKVNQRRYSEEFKRLLLEEMRQGKWASPYAAGKAYGIRPVSISSWMDAAGMTHLRHRTVEIKTLSEVSELNKLRKVNRTLRDQLLDEVLARREDLAVLDAAGRKYGFSPAVFREEFRKGKELQRVTNAAGCGIL